MFPRPYQEAGVAKIVSALTGVRGNRAFLLADQPGVGKTLQALLAAADLEANRILVIAPAIARGSWPIEVGKFDPSALDYFRVIGPDEMPSSVDLDASMTLLLFAYDTFSRPRTTDVWCGALRARKWDLLILDEAHYLKGASNRTGAIYGQRPGEGVQSVCRHVLLLTGTPTPNHAGEMYEHVRAFWPTRFTIHGQPMTRDQFDARYTHYRETQYGRQYTGSQNQADLRERLAPVFLQRRLAEVAMPPLTLQDVPLPVDPLGFTPTRLPPGLAETEDDDLFLAALAELPLTTLRRELGEFKADAAAGWIAARLDSGTTKILVFAWHHSVISRVEQHLKRFNPVVITGATIPADRVRHARAFQEDPAVRVFIGQVVAAGTAITLHAAHEVAIVEPSWVPGENTQAIARAHRMGQTKRVLASFLYVPGTLDARIMRAFRRKAEQIAEIYDTTSSAA